MTVAELQIQLASLPPEAIVLVGDIVSSSQLSDNVDVSFYPSPCYPMKYDNPNGCVEVTAG